MTTIVPNICSHLLSEIGKFNHDITGLTKTERDNQLDLFYQKLEQIKKVLETVSREEKDKTDIKLLDLVIPIFGLAYYGVSVSSHINLVLDIYRDIFQSFIGKWRTYYEKNKCSGNPAITKVLFISERLNRFSSVLRDRVQVIQGLAKLPDFTVDIMTENTMISGIPELYNDCINLIPLKDLETNLKRIISMRYDVVVFPDLHMDGKTSALSLFRLAPKMITTFGHSETSGTCD